MAEETSELKRTNYDTLTAPREEYPPTVREARGIEVRTGPEIEETEHIKSQIEETRKEMGETIDAIQERLSFSNISDQVSEHVSNAIETAKNTVYDATVGKAVGFMKTMGNEITDSNIVRTARNNPFPFILIGLGAGLLAYNSFSGRKKPRSFGRRYDRQDLGPREENSRGGRSMLAGAQEKVSGVTETVTGAASSAYEGVSHAMDSAVTGARDYANRAYSTAGEYGHAAHKTYDRYLEENPLIVGATALALGALVGLAIPATRYEGELMGEARDDLFRKAQDTGSNLLDKTKRIVDQAANTVSKEARAVIH